MSANPGSEAKWLDFDGRLGRTEFWLHHVSMIVTSIVVGVLAGVVAGILQGIAGLPPAVDRLLGVAAYLTPMLVSLALALATLGATVRRLHDAALPGWLALIAFAPYGVLATFALALLPGTVGPNRYGPDPREDPATDPSIVEAN
jgi:uncharacterized membrane protein YhaH (DUF805 family)